MKFSTAVGMGLAFAPLSLATFRESNMGSSSTQGRSQGGSQGGSLSGSLQGGSSGGRTVIVIPNKGSANNRQGNNNNNVMGGESPPTNTQNGVQGVQGSAGNQVFMVNVGGSSGLVFEPQQIKGAKVGDRVQFMMLSKNHSVTESTFEKPCEIKQGGQNSGFLPNPNNTSPPPTFMFEVKDTKPVWMYCAQADHCSKGMVFSLNPTEEKTHETFQQLALNSTKGGGQTGGQVTLGGQAQAGAGTNASCQAPVAGTSVSSSVSSVQTGTGTTGGSISVPGVQKGTEGSLQGSQGAQQGSQGAQQGGQNGNVATGTGRLNPDGSCNCVAVCNGSAGGINGFLDADCRNTLKMREEWIDNLDWRG